MTELEKRNRKAMRYSSTCRFRREKDRAYKRALGGAIICFLWALSLWAVALLAAMR